MENQKNWHAKHVESFDLGNRIADSVAKGMGSWNFIIIQTILVIFWMSLNLIGFMYHWDVYPFYFTQSFILYSGSLCCTHHYDVTKQAE